MERNKSRKAQATVTPSNDFLMERSTRKPDEKPEEQPFLLPASTSIIDDYFFIHREVLVWRSLATACKHDKGALQCPGSQKTQFGDDESTPAFFATPQPGVCRT